MAYSDNALGYYGRLGQTPTATSQRSATLNSRQGQIQAAAEGDYTNLQDSSGTSYNQTPAGGWNATNWKTHPWYSQINNWYNQYLGREADDGAWIHYGNPGGLPGAEDAIRYSKEAFEYLQKQAQNAQQPAQNATSGSQYGTASPTGTPVAPDGTVPPAMPSQDLLGMAGSLGGRVNGTTTLPSWDSLGWQPYQAQQFSPPAGYDERTNALWNSIQGLLDNPTFSPQNLAGMKEVQKEQALSMADQLKDAYGERAASRGTLLGGTTQGALQDIEQQSIADILNAYRDIDIMGAERNAADQARSIGLGQSLLGQQFSNAAQMFGLNADEGRYAFEQQTTPLDYQIKLALAQEGLDDAANRRTLSWAQFLENALMGRYGLGYNYANLQQMIQDSMLGRLLGYGN